MKKVIILSLGILVSAALGAQTLQTSYFSEDFTYSYRLNPAFHPEYSFVGLPFAGLTTGAYKGNFALNDIFYKNGGERVTFMNESVASADFLGNLKKGLNNLNLESYTNLLSASRPGVCTTLWMSMSGITRARSSLTTWEGFSRTAPLPTGYMTCPG